MIPADHVHDNDDGTMWLVFKFGTGLNGEAWEELDHPCDNCGGVGSLHPGGDDNLCPDCHGTGRHVFEIEVEAEVHWDCYRVHVVPDMVLQIYDWNGKVLPKHDGSPYVVMDAPGWKLGTCHLWTGSKWEPIILPPAAKPGDWAVLLQEVDRDHGGSVHGD